MTYTRPMNTSSCRSGWRCLRFVRRKIYHISTTHLRDWVFSGAIERFDEDAAVAHIVLSAIQERLPQWAAVEIDAVGNTIHTARPIQKGNKKKIELKPQHLITINWANTGPGISWPAAYHLTWLPHYDVNI